MNLDINLCELKYKFDKFKNHTESGRMGRLIRRTQNAWPIDRIRCYCFT